MSTCEECAYFFLIPEDADDYEPEKGDCVTEKKDEKGKYWLSKAIFGNSETCTEFRNR